MGLLKGHVLLAWNLIREGLTEMFHFISKRFVMKIDLFPISVFVSDDNFNSDGKHQLYLFEENNNLWDLLTLKVRFH